MQSHARLQAQYNLIFAGSNQLPLLRVRPGLRIRILNRDGCPLRDSKGVARCDGEGVRAGSGRGEDGGVRVLLVEDFGGGLFGKRGDQRVHARVPVLVEVGVALRCTCVEKCRQWRKDVNWYERRSYPGPAKPISAPR